jgi:hypothetical protein
VAWIDRIISISSRHDTATCSFTTISPATSSCYHTIHRRGGQSSLRRGSRPSQPLSTARVVPESRSVDSKSTAPITCTTANIIVCRACSGGDASQTDTSENPIFDAESGSGHRLAITRLVPFPHPRDASLDILPCGRSGRVVPPAAGATSDAKSRQ